MKQHIPKSDHQYFIYLRKSTGGEERQVRSIPDQLAEVRELIRREELQVVDVIAESQSAKFKGRPIFNALQESYDLLRRRGGWAAFTLHALVLLAMAGLTLLSNPLSALFTVPLALCYLAAGYLEDTRAELLPPAALDDPQAPARA